MASGDSGFRGFTRTYPAIPSCVGAIRRTVDQFARDAGAPRRTIDAMTLAASEAATNVVLHAYRDSTERGHIEVVGAQMVDELLVTVRDSGTGLKRGAHGPGLGIGLAIIVQQADRLDLLEPPTGGLEVRMHFAHPAPRSG